MGCIWLQRDSLPYFCRPCACQHRNCALSTHRQHFSRHGLYRANNYIRHTGTYHSRDFGTLALLYPDFSDELCQVELFHHSRDVPATISKLIASLDRASGAVIKQNPRFVAYCAKIRRLTETTH
jgi:hypothetical protein